MRFLPIFLEESFDEWQCDMICTTLVHECGVCCPIDTGDGPGDEPRFERRELIHKSEPVTCFHHPLNVRGGSRRICQAEWDSHVGEHLYKSRVGRRMRLWITKYLNSICNFMDVHMGFVGECILRTHADDQWGLRDLLHVVKCGIDGHWENSAIQ